MAAVLGRNMILSVGGSDVTGQTDGTLTLTGDTVDVTVKSDAGVTAYLQSREGWTFDASGILDDEADTGWVALYTAFNAQTVAACVFTTPAAATWTGNAYVTSLEITGPSDDTLSYSVSLQGTGAITKA
jgi:TP901-1 family phage major tail protein